MRPESLIYYPILQIKKLRLKDFLSLTLRTEPAEIKSELSNFYDLYFVYTIFQYQLKQVKMQYDSDFNNMVMVITFWMFLKVLIILQQEF